MTKIIANYEGVFVGSLVSCTIL